MSTPKVDADDDVIPEFDFSRAIPSHFRDHVIARRRARSWWIEIDEIDGSGRPARWSTIESTARQVIARSRGIDPSDFDLVIDLPSNGNSR